MKRSIILSLVIAFIAAPASGFKQENLDKLKATNACEMCDLRETYLREANLFRADLRKADLSDSDLTGADLRDSDLTGTTFCKTMMPDGSVKNANG